MAVTLVASGTRAATVTTEHFESSPNVAGSFVFYVDLADMAAGDVVELRAYKMTVASGTARVVYYERYEGVQPTDNVIAVSQRVPNTLTDANAVRFSIKQTYGTSCDLPWAVLNVEDATAAVSANVTQWNGSNVATPSVAGVPEVDVTHFNGTAGTFAAGIPETKVASLAAGAITAAAIATDAIDADALAADAVAEIADGLIARNIAGGSSTGRTVGHALAAIRNKSAITAIDETAGTATLTVYDTDDTSVLFTAAISLTTLTKSITAMDPA
jgi:hypothetical protein